LKNSPAATEILVELAKPRRFAERSGGFDSFFKNFNEEVPTTHTLPG